jgi:hypothetical protein
VPSRPDPVGTTALHPPSRHAVPDARRTGRSRGSVPLVLGDVLELQRGRPDARGQARLPEAAARTAFAQADGIDPGVRRYREPGIGRTLVS